VISPFAEIVEFGIGPKTAGIETENPRQSDSNCDRFHAELAIPYQRRIDIRFVPIFLNAWD
jgi:hypothetical protein